jgi:hypothetical protein
MFLSAGGRPSRRTKRHMVAGMSNDVVRKSFCLVRDARVIRILSQQSMRRCKRGADSVKFYRMRATTSIANAEASPGDWRRCAANPSMFAATGSTVKRD